MPPRRWAAQALHPDDTKHRFKPEWREKRRERAIKPYAERISQQQQRQALLGAFHDRRREHLRDLSLASGFNPISGKVIDRGSGQWITVTDPWLDRKGGKKVGYSLGPSAEVLSKRQLSSDHRQELRCERIRKDGLFTTKKLATAAHSLMAPPA